MTVEELLESGIIGRYQPIKFINDNALMGRNGDRVLGCMECATIPSEKDSDFYVYNIVKNFDVLFVWNEVDKELIDDNNPMNITVRTVEEEDKRTRYRPYKKRYIKCIENGRTYASTKDVADSLNVSIKQINNHLSGITHSAGGYHLQEIYDDIER